MHEPGSNTYYVFEVGVHSNAKVSESKTEPRSVRTMVTYIIHRYTFDVMIRRIDMAMLALMKRMAPI